MDVADANFAPVFVDHGAEVPPGTPPGPTGAKQYVGNALKNDDSINSDDSCTRSMARPYRLVCRDIHRTSGHASEAAHHVSRRWSWVDFRSCFAGSIKLSAKDSKFRSTR